MGPVPRRISIPRPHEASGLCALGFTQFKADGLVQTYGLPTSNHSYDHTTSNHTPFHSFSEKNKFHPIALLA